MNDKPSANKHAPVPPRLVFTDPAMWLAFGFGSGLAPKAPGTAGTIAAIPLAIMLTRSGLSLPLQLLIVAAVTLIGVYLCGYAANKLGVHDHGGIVWDEIAGYLLTVVWFPATWVSWLLGFVLFRIFDILKPWPIRELDHRMSGGLGIMLDDVVAAIFAAAVMAAIAWSTTWL